MRIGVDLDEVMVDFTGRFVSLYESWFGFPLAGEIVEWDDVLTLSHFKNHSELFDWFDRAGGWDDMTPVPGAGGGIDSLIADGHSVVFITARQLAGAQEAMDWFEESPWGWPTQMVTNTHNKASVPCSVYIDDSPHVLKDLKAAGKQTIIFDRPWNKTSRSGKRAKDWNQVLLLLADMD